MFWSIRGKLSGVREIIRAKEAVAIPPKKELWDCVTEWGEISFRLMWVKLKAKKERWVIVSAYGPGSERREEQEGSFGRPT